MTVERGSTVVIVRDVPAEVCDTCGEDYLDSEVAAAIETLLVNAARAGVRLEDREYAVA